LKIRLTPEELGRVQAAAERLYNGQLARFGLTCSLEDWEVAREEIARLREAVYRGKLPHMLGEGLPVDADDQRAFHFVARREGVAVAALRLLPSPFEATAIFPNLDEILRPDGRYIELGRLVGTPGSGEVGASRVLALHALVWGLGQTDFDGLIAYARERASNHFRLLGMEEVARIAAVPGRAEQPYVLLAAHLENTLKALDTWH
jgi:hypothetical protein